MVIRSNGSSRQILARAFVAASTVRRIQLDLFQKKDENGKIEKTTKIFLLIVATILARPMAIVQQAFVHIQAVALCHHDKNLDKYDSDDVHHDSSDTYMMMMMMMTMMMIMISTLLTPPKAL